MYTVSRSPSQVPAIAAMRPLIAADPMLRAPRPEMVSESNLAGPLATGGVGIASAGAVAGGAVAAAGVAEAWLGAPGAGGTKSEASRATLASMRSNVTLPRSAADLPLGPDSTENGRYQPLTAL